MKKTLLIAAIAGLTFIACKKDRTCTCTNSVISKSSTQPGYTYTAQEPTTTTTKYTKIKKNSVYGQICVTQDITQTANQTVYTGSTTTNYVVTTVSKNDCTLK